MKWYVPEMYVPNFEAWDSLMAGQQQKYNSAIAATQKYPKHLEWRGDLAGQYKQETNAAVEDITNTFVNEGVRAGNAKMRDFAFNLNQQWNPGGLAYELEKEYDEYIGGIKQITDYYEKNKAENSANRKYSLADLNKAARQPLNKDAKTGIYSRSTLTPNLIPYVDIADEAFKVAKEIKESGTTNIIKLDKAWFEKIQKEGVTAETIQKVTEQLLQQPKYAQQLGVEKWLIDQNTTPEQKVALEENAKKTILQSSTSKTDRIQKLMSSSKKSDKESLQTALQELGYYTGKIDGNIGKDTKAAIDAYKADLESKTQEQISNTNYDSIINKQMIDSYTKPLVNTFAYEKIKKDLIFNKEWETNAKIAAQRKNTQDMVTAIQSLRNPETSDYLPSPGLGTPMQAFDKLRKQSEDVYNQSKQSFDQISQASGITTLIGTTAPNKVHELTQARVQSKSYEDFRKRIGELGYTDDKTVNGLWDFYNSPSAGSLNNAYVSMLDAKNQVDNIDKSRSSMISDFIKTSEGKKELLKFKKATGFKGSDDEFAKTIVNKEFKYTTPGLTYSVGMHTPVSTGSNTVDLGSQFKKSMDNYYKSKPLTIPQSLRGYSVNSLKGEGSVLEKTILDDIQSGYTLGYSSNGQAGITFTKVGTSDKVDLSNVKLDQGKMRFDVNASGITYYLTGKDADGNTVSAVVDAPKEHYGRLSRMALDMKKEARDGNDESLDAVANELYAVINSGPRYENAIEDALVLNDKNSNRLTSVIDPQRSTNGRIETFTNNANVKGTPVGEEKEVNGNTYQKFKVYNPSTKTSSYMMTVKTSDGLHLPVKNKNGGYYYETSQEAESPLWDNVMMSQLPVDIDQKKINNTNITDEEAKALMIGVNFNNNE